jgi:hypothetical protein
MRTIRTLARTGAAAVTLGGLLAGTAGCGSPDITKARLQQALVPTFENLYVQQAGILGITGMTVAGIGASADCDKGGPKIPDVGAGPNWICMMIWRDNQGQPQTGKFEVTVRTDGTYVAGGPPKITGLATITDTHGHDVPNPVFEFDGVINPGT